MKKIYLNKSRKGTALVIAMFLSIIATIMTLTMMSMADTNTSQVTDNRSGISAYYAAESGIEEVKNFFNRNISSMGEDLSTLDLPEAEAPFKLANNSKYWVESMTYENSNQTVIVEVIGNSDNAFRKVRAKLKTSIPSVFNDYGLLTDGILTIHGTKVLNMSVHGNDGLSFSGGDTLNNNAVATQSNDPTADPPHSTFNPVGGYVPEVSVPIIPIDDLRTESQSDGIILDIDQDDLYAQINNAPAGSNIYIAANPNINKNNIIISGDMEGKTIFLDGDINIDISGESSLSDITVVTAGDMLINGSVDIISSHPDEIDVVFAAGGDVDLNGSRAFTSLFWANGRFTQNGASLSGRVIADEAIFLNGSFILTSSDEVTDLDLFEKVMSTASWQIISMD